MAYTTINKSGDYFNTKLFTGNGGTQSITGVGFQPDWVWLKSRSVADSPILFDAVRGVTKRLMTNSTGAESTEAQEVQSFDSDGFTVGSSDNANRSGATMVGWNWKAGGAGSSNSDGSVTSTVSVSTTSGFSIVKYTGTGSAGATIGHGLGAVPAQIVVKGINRAESWEVYNQNLEPSNASYMRWDSTQASAGSAYWNSTSPTSSVFTLNSAGGVNATGIEYVAYCFAEIKGFSKFGSYIGNGNADGTFVYTGFKPAFVMVKNIINITDWWMKDSKRPGYNQVNDLLYPNLSNAEEHGGDIDMVSNGFKVRTTATNTNENGDKIIYMAFGQSLVGSNGVTAKAR
jgi:hypothetical protein